MIIQLSPQVRDRNKIWYEIEHQKITATINNVSDTFDFTDMPDGKLQLHDGDNNMIETTLDEVPILGAEKTDGVLTVEILFSIDSDEQDERLLFPKPMTLDEFNDLMGELAEREKPEEDESVDDDIIVEDERVDEEELVYKDDYIIDLEEVDF